MTSEGLATLKLTLELGERCVLTGQLFEVVVRMENTGAAPIELVEPDGVSPGPLEYELRHQSDPASSVTLSRAGFERLQRGGPTGGGANLVTLAPGASVEVKEEPGQYAVGGLHPGRYEVRARWTQPGLEAESAAVPLEVEVARPAHLTALLCRRSVSNCAVFDHPTATGTLILERTIESFDPTIAAFARVHFVPAPDVVTDVCAALHCGVDIQGRWHAWLQGRGVFGARTWSGVMMAKPAPGRSAIASPRLAKPMFHLASGVGRVLVFGSLNGQLAIELWGSEARALKLVATLTLPSVSPLEMQARIDETSGDMGLFWSEREANRTRLQALWLDARGQQRASLRTLYEGDLPARAFALDSLGPIDESVVHVLVGPDADDRLTLMRIPWSGSGSSWSQRAPSEAQAALWAVSAPPAPNQPERGTADERPWVICTVGTRLLVTDMVDGWRILREEADLEVRHLHMLTGSRGGWVGWHQGAYGLRYLQLYRDL